MAKHLIVFGHGNGDTGTTSSNRTEADTVRKLKPYLEKWGKQSKDSFTFYNGNLFKGRAMHKQKGYDTVTEIHLDGPRGNGGHVIINASFKPDNIDKRLRDVIKKHFGIVGHLQKNDGFSYRTDLYNINQARTHGINYRMLELFFLSNEQHYNHYMSNLDQIAKEIVEAISNTKVSSSAKPQPGWIKNNTGWWYQNADGSYPHNQWQKINGKWYLFDKRGYMLKGWQKVKGAWYYMDNSGAMQTGWVKLKDVWYYLNNNGVMATGWQKVKGAWYYMNNSGAMQTGLITIGGKHYYLERSGALITDESIELEANKHGHLK